jgi:hypothetical protein
MSALRRRAWWPLAAFTVLAALFGLGDVLAGATADALIPLGLVGLSPADLQAETARGFRLYDYAARSGGLLLIVIGIALTLIVVIPYRRGEPWAWWTMWLFPIWAAAVVALLVAFGIAPNQAPPPPMISGVLLGAIAAGALLLDRPRFTVGTGPPARARSTPDPAEIGAGTTAR